MCAGIKHRFVLCANGNDVIAFACKSFNDSFNGEVIAFRGARGEYDFFRLSSNQAGNLFAGNVTAFLRDETPIFDDIRNMLDQQFARLSTLERELLIWLAIDLVL